MKKTVIIAVIIALGCGVWFGKLHRTRECVITNVNDDNLSIIVQHPNGLEYGCYVDCTENLDEGETIKVVFDELTEWEKNYRIKEIK